MRRLLPALLAAAFALPAAAQTHVAPTEALSPADERAAFKLPPGFEAQLVAAEPDIGKPIQIAFDARGRLWVTTSRHYPFPAEGKASDKLYVLSDFGPDGKAKTVTAFADDLNIPIGVLPLPDCKSCLVSHAGSILKLTDTDGDGKADKRETVLTGFGTKDTHGMMNSFVLLPDGWVYACHGYLNTSVVTAKDGSQVTMNSGNTFRFRPDGSRVEPWTFGQVNPFGMTVDPYLNLYTADCHSKPITQLIRGAYYDSFGKPHDGLGYAPHVTRHDHKSTALCGLAWYEADHFPKEWNGVLFLGNVTGNRVNCDRIEWKGSTPVGRELPDFLVSSDPWFRPTDVKLGPDGALYVADFYNRIIGHYEVDLRHPGRDKDRGRVWRVVYKGTDGKAKPPRMPGDLTRATVQDLERLTADPNLAVRLAVTNEMIRRDGSDNAKRAWNPPDDVSGPRRAVAVVPTHWAEFRNGSSKINDLANPLTYRSLSRDLAGPDGAALIYTHELRMAAALPNLSGELQGNIVHCLDLPPIVARAAVEAMIAHPHWENIAPLVKLIQSCPAEDTHLRHAARVALRNALREYPGAWAMAGKADPAVTADVALGVPSKEAAAYLLKHLQAGRLDAQACERIGRYGDDAQAAAVVAVVKGKQTDPAAVHALLALHRGAQARGGSLPADAGPVAEDVCRRGLESGRPGIVQAATELAGGMKLTALFDPLAQFAGRADRNEAQRAAVFTALLAIDPAKAVPTVVKVLTDPAAPAGLRDRAAQALAGSNQPAAREALVAALHAAPAQLAGVIAAALSTNPEGAVALLEAIRLGKASPRLLQDKVVAVRLALVAGGRFKEEAEALRKGLPSADARIDELVRVRADGLRKAKPDPAAGQKVFAQHCGNCHQVGGQGAKVGPQLDGIGNRGADRLLEDVLDPNRNVDAAFRAINLNLVDGRTVTGLLLREEGQVLVVADAAGKEVRVDGKDVDKRTTSPLWPMPANFDTAIPEAEFYHLLAYLLEQRAKDPPGKR